MRPFWGMVFTLGGAALAAACGTGTDVEATFSTPSGGTTSGGGGAGAGSASDSSSSSSQAASSSAASSSASSSSSSGAGGGGGCDYSASDTCLMPVELTSIDGDQGNETRTVSGTTSAWFKV